MNMPGLPKWSGLLVVGDTVTHDQAAEIIVRTSSLFFSSNDRGWLRELAAETGLVVDEIGHPKDWKQLRALEEGMRRVPVEHLQNTGRIASAWIGGARGWIRWDGRVYAADYNIGKHPSAEEVADEWSKIAAAWPLLRLRAQLLDREIGEEGPVPLIEFEVARSVVVHRKPEAILTAPVPPDPVKTVYDIAYNPVRERACTMDDFRRGLALARGTGAVR